MTLDEKRRDLERHAGTSGSEIEPLDRLSRLPLFHTSVTLLATAKAVLTPRWDVRKPTASLRSPPTGRGGHALEDKRGGDGRPKARSPSSQTRKLFKLQRRPASPLSRVALE